jgi:heat shock protein HtpX
MNTLKVAFMMFLLTGLFLLVGDLFGGGRGMVLALVIAGLLNGVSYFFSDRIVLSMYGAKKVTEAEAPQLYRIVRELAAAAELPMPSIAIIPQDAPNAFATGRDHHHAVVAVTQGMLRMAGEDELKGVLGHELGHVRNYDMLIGTVAATFAAAIAFLPRMFFYAGMFGGRDSENRSPLGPVLALAGMILLPLVALLLRMAISRSAEYRADAAGARYSGNPLGLAGALEKLDSYAHRIPLQGNEVTSHLFIVNPFNGKNVLSLFSTHPPIAERVRRLRAMTGR